MRITTRMVFDAACVILAVAMGGGRSRRVEQHPRFSLRRVKMMMFPVNQCRGIRLRTRWVVAMVHRIPTTGITQE